MEQGPVRASGVGHVWFWGAGSITAPGPLPQLLPLQARAGDTGSPDAV